MHLYGAAASKQIDQAITQSGKTNVLLMMRAARAVWHVALNAHNAHNAKSRVWCCAGAGNNGGDAYGVAALATMDGHDVVMIGVSAPLGTAQAIADFAAALGVHAMTCLPPLDRVAAGDIVIDGLFGSGLNRAPQGLFAQAIDWINAAAQKGAHVISIDVPSGIDATSGAPHGVAVKANDTVMCLSAKQGCYSGAAPDWVGCLHFADLGCKAISDVIAGDSILLTPAYLSLPTRHKTGHKGNYGTVVVLGGWGGMAGAGCLAAHAALAIGAGKVHLCADDTAMRPPEVMQLERDLPRFTALFDIADCIVAGSGLGQGQEADAFLLAVWQSNIPLVLDADGLRWLGRVNPPPRTALWIGTPHPGEARFLLGGGAASIDNRFAAIADLHRRYGGQWVLKGAGTLIGVDPIYVNPFADDILATAGAGDVLAGMIGGLVAQKANQAAALGVWMHARAAHMLRSEGRARMTASELIGKLGHAMARL